MQRETERFIYKKINDTDRPFFAGVRRSAGGLVLRHICHQSQTPQQPDPSNVMRGHNTHTNEGRGPLIMCLGAGLTRSLKRDCVGIEEHTRVSIRSEWSWVGSGSASSSTSSICETTLHNSRRLLSFIKRSLSPPRLYSASQGSRSPVSELQVCVTKLSLWPYRKSQNSKCAISIPKIDMLQSQLSEAFAIQRLVLKTQLKKKED